MNAFIAFASDNDINKYMSVMCWQLLNSLIGAEAMI